MTVQGEVLSRILSCLTVLKTDFEYLAYLADENNNPKRAKKTRNVYGDKINWVLRDMITSTVDQRSYELIYEEMKGERMKDFTEWIDFGLKINNLHEVIESLKTTEIK